MPSALANLYLPPGRPGQAEKPLCIEVLTSPVVLNAKPSSIQPQNRLTLHSSREAQDPWCLGCSSKSNGTADDELFDFLSRLYNEQSSKERHNVHKIVRWKYPLWNERRNVTDVLRSVWTHRRSCCDTVEKRQRFERLWLCKHSVMSIVASVLRQVHKSIKIVLFMLLNSIFVGDNEG